ncbi:outer membrane transport energization protein TonB [Lutibacter oricola]|uniref:Outer membrane transport energization protein TonB n=1 Tax=Lutibacter oricola TaxID=762486 RepID=A0A1H3GJ49_9FLAO|nr:hypothetical protein [Lutibacter oricola]SDY03127.1 outer membrane transport energization protein TonB [Lutibacter oricola]
MSNILDTKNKRKSAAITSVIMSLLLVGVFFFGLNYLDPPEEYGIAVNFGTSDFGKGDIQPTEPIKTTTQEKVVEEEIEEVEEVKQTVDNTNDVTEEVITQNTEDAIAIKKKQEAKRKADEEARIEKERLEAIAKKKAEQDAKKKALDNLINGVKNSDGTTTGGQGNDNINGDKGKINGDPNADGYYGNGGSGGNGNYNLGNRKPLSKPKPKYDCDEEGLVVVRIEVDRNGKVIKASPGAKGTTNTAQCLLSQAKLAALKTKWNADSKAPSKQFGTIKYRFSLSQ